MNIGDTAYASFGRYGVTEVMAGKVARVSPTGQVTVDFEEVWPGDSKKRLRRFTVHGDEIGADRYAGYLIDEATFKRLAQKQRAEEAILAVASHLRQGWSFKSKADVNSFVTKLVELAALIPDDA